MKSDYGVQRTFFNEATHQYPLGKILTPAPAQQLEIDQMERLLALPPNSRIMDFGAGTGRMTFPFLARGYHVHAVDIAEQSLSALKTVYREQKASGWGKLTTATRLTDGGRFDGIIGSDVLHHVSLEETLPALYSCLRPGGTILFSEPNAWHPLWYPFILLKLSWVIERGILQCSLPNLTRQTRAAGFSAVTVYGHGLLPTGILNALPSLAQANAHRWGNIPIVRPFAFRLLIRAQRSLDS